MKNKNNSLKNIPSIHILLEFFQDKSEIDRKYLKKIIQNSIDEIKVKVLSGEMIIDKATGEIPSKIKNLALIPTFAIGGGGDSDLVWELFPEIQYQFTETIAGRLGYRTVGYEFDGNGDNELDLNFEGLVAGMSFTF